MDNGVDVVRRSMRRLVMAFLVLPDLPPRSIGSIRFEKSFRMTYRLPRAEGGVTRFNRVTGGDSTDTMVMVCGGGGAEVRSGGGRIQSVATDWINPRQ